MLTRLAKFSLFTLIFSLIFMQPFVLLAGYRAIATDIIFLVTFALWTCALLFRQTEFRRHKFYPLLIFYFVTMAVSGVFSADQRTSFIKLLGELYLLSLPVLVINLIENKRDLERALKIWLAATAILILLGAASIFLFYLDRENHLLDFTRFSFGSLPPGNYPRLMLTFLNANMLCNYLSVSVMSLLILRKLNRINQITFYTLLAGIFFCAFFTISPSLGGIALCLGLWFWIRDRKAKPFAAKIYLTIGILIAAAFVAALMIAPKIHPTAPFVVDVPFTEIRLVPSVRVLNWSAGWQTFAENPFFGRGVGQDACHVKYFDPSGSWQTLTDAHNVFINVAAQMGIFGLLAVLLIIAYLARKTFPLRFTDERDVYRIGFGLAFFSAFVYQGIGGSYEDARHLWILIGFFLASENLTAESAQ